MPGPVFHNTETATSVNTDYWKIGDYWFEWKKTKTNQTNAPIGGERCVNGYWPNGEFVGQAVFSGQGDPQFPQNWNKIEN